MRMWGVVRLVGWLGLLGGAITGLSALASVLPGPPSSPAAWGAWLTARDPATAAFAVTRVATLGLAWYLLVATAVGTVVRVVREPRMVLLADLVTVPFVRRVLHAALGFGVAGATFAGIVGQPPAAWAEGSAEQGLMLQRGEDGEVLLQRLPADTPAHLPVVADPIAPAPPVVASSPQPEKAPAVAQWTVAPGEHFWSIAERVLADAWGRPPTPNEVTPYWRALVDANRAALPDPENPDLIYPGDTYVLPPLPA
jgi:hypothetical protein